jgi:pyocin large subunit-like protein
MPIGRSAKSLHSWWSIIINGFNKLDKHFIKHGAEFWLKTAQAYLDQATNFIKSAASNKNIVQWTRASGGAKFYVNKVTNEVANLHSNWNIWTYFKLTKDTVANFIKNNK